VAWGFAYAAALVLLYSRPLFNAAPPLPLLVPVILLPFLLRPATLGMIVACAAFLAGCFYAVLGIKSLALTHRERWTQGIGYSLAYASFIAFFANRGVPLPAAWLVTMAISASVARAIIPDWRLAMPIVAIVAEGLWTVSWLPVGFLSSANIAALMFFFMADSVREDRMTARRIIGFAILFMVIAGSSSWVF
jgi:hypothetical protein